VKCTKNTVSLFSFFYVAQHNVALLGWLLYFSFSLPLHSSFGARNFFIVRIRRKSGKESEREAKSDSEIIAFFTVFSSPP
jgi:hypothetical protein